ncbi:MAG: conjugal transfer protein TrbI [Citromicrobium sp.]|nr:conjugal transfer protein TrbI [Citromicrobium sp.]|tara:strand:+ start:2733 stop:3812 length:1080 start_codon:yes stop_codon:yes gene_type:complete
MAEAVQPQSPGTPASDPTPLVERAGSGNVGLIVFAVLLAIGGAWILSVMSTARQQAAISPISAPQAAAGRIEAAPPPELPARFGNRPYAESEAEGRPTPVRLVRAAPAPVRVSGAAARMDPPDTSASSQFAPSPQTRSFIPETQFVPVAPSQRPALPDPPTRLEESSSPSGERVRARRFENPAYTVPLGTIIPAVLETALDSTRSGSARAIVQQNVFAFDGSRVLIPRGSRLYGQYEGDLKAGQNRALVTWTRLMRPDGVTIALESDASDQLGRAGIRGRVDSKFFQRFGGALLQSVLDIGVGIATREATDGLIVALPGSVQNVTRIDQQQVTPTLTVKHGTSISVYVARDLDFLDVGG